MHTCSWKWPSLLRSFPYHSHDNAAAINAFLHNTYIQFMKCYFVCSSSRNISTVIWTKVEWTKLSLLFLLTLSDGNTPCGHSIHSCSLSFETTKAWQKAKASARKFLAKSATQIRLLTMPKVHIRMVAEDVGLSHNISEKKHFLWNKLSNFWNFNL